MHFLHMLRLSVLPVLLLLSMTHSLTIRSSSASPFNEINKRVMYHDSVGNMRYFLNSFVSINPWSLGTCPYALASVYNHATTLLLQSQRESPQQSTLGFHQGSLSLGFRTTTGTPIPWESAIKFINLMLASLHQHRIGPEFQAFITDVALDVTIEVSLRLLLDGQLPPIGNED